MMRREDVERAAWLARLELREGEAEEFARELGRALEGAREMVSLDVSGVEPTLYGAELANALRPDEVGPSLSQQEALSGSSHVEQGYFSVPRIT